MRVEGWSVLLAGMAIAASASAPQGPTATNRTDEIVVTATRVESDPLTTPYSTHRIDGRLIGDERAFRTTPDALQIVPSAMIQKTSNGQGSPFLRGFTGFRTLMLIDGIRLNNSTYRDGPNQYWNTVDSLSLRALDVVMGPASVLYGSDAIGGTVNALPVRPPPEDGPEWTRRAYYRTSTAENSNLGRLEVGGRPGKDTGFVAGLSLKNFGDVEGGKDVGEQPYTGYDEWDFDARLEQRVSERAVLTFGHQTVRQNDAWRTHRTIYGIDWEGLKHGTDLVLSYDQARDLTWFTLDAEEPGDYVDNVRVTVYRHAQSEDEYRVKEDAAGGERGFDVKTWGTSVQMETGSEFGRWIYGVDIARDNVDSYSHKLKSDGSVGKTDIQGPVADDATYDTIGTYVQNIVSWMDNRLQAIPGLRYTYNRANADRVADPVNGGVMTVDGDWDAVVGSLRASLAVNEAETIALFAGASQGFRAPNLSDLTRFDNARSGELETPVTDLEPERFLSLEAGVKFRSRTSWAQAAVYRTLIEDLIVRTPTGRTIGDALEVTKKNSGDGWVQGAEFTGEYRFLPDWAMRVLAAWQSGEVDSYPTSDPVLVRDNMTRMMPPTAEVALRYQPVALRAWVEFAVRGSSEADDLSAEDKRDAQRIPPGGTPGYVVAAIRGGVRLWADTHLTAAVENLADEDYRIHGSGVNEPGRNIILAVDSRF